MLKAAAWAAVVLVSLSTFTLPSVRAAARSFLDLFRVVNFAPIRIDESRIGALKTNIDLPQLMADQFQVLKEAAPPQTVASIAAAAELPRESACASPRGSPVGLEQQEHHGDG